MTTQIEIPHKNWFKRHPYIWLTVFFTVAAFVFYSLAGKFPSGGANGWVILGTAFSFLIPAPFILFYSRMVFQAIDQARIPVPTPAEIELALWKQNGVQPSLQDVLAVHQMLQSQKNRDVFAAAALVGVGVLGARQMEGHGLL